MKIDDLSWTGENYSDYSRAFRQMWVSMIQIKSIRSRWLYALLTEHLKNNEEYFNVDCPWFHYLRFFCFTLANFIALWWRTICYYFYYIMTKHYRLATYTRKLWKKKALQLHKGHAIIISVLPAFYNLYKY